MRIQRSTGHSIEALSPSEIDKGSPDEATGDSLSSDISTSVAEHMTGGKEEAHHGSQCRQGSSGANSGVEDVSIVLETPESVVQETPPELQSAPAVSCLNSIYPSERGCRSKSETNVDSVASSG